MADPRLTVLEIINKVEQKRSIPESVTLSDNDFTKVLLQLLNEVVTDLSDSGDWQELFQEVTISAVSSAKSYSVSLTGKSVHNIYEVAFGSRIAPLFAVSISDIKRLNRLSSHGVPSQYSIVGVDASANPIIEVFPVPATAQSSSVFTVHCYEKPPIYTTSDAATVVPFPAQVVIQGLNAKTLLEENGGEMTGEYQAEYQIYTNMKQQAMNRLTADTGHTVRFRPPR